MTQYGNQPFNFGDSPAAPAGKQNVVFQADAPNTDPTVVRNVSAYVEPGGGSSDKVVLLSGTHTLATDENVAFCNGTFTVTLPATPDQKLLYTINIESGTVTIAPSSGTINGNSSVIGTMDYSFGLRFDGTNWRIV